MSFVAFNQRPRTETNLTNAAQISPLTPPVQMERKLFAQFRSERRRAESDLKTIKAKYNSLWRQINADSTSRPGYNCYMEATSLGKQEIYHNNMMIFSAIVTPHLTSMRFIWRNNLH